MTRTLCIVVPLVLLLPVACGQVDLRTDAFIHYGQSLSWADARAYCRKYHTDLVTITSETENQKMYNAKGWIGLYRDDSTKPWKWSTNDQIANYTNWKSGDQTEGNNCAFKHNTTSQWETDRCYLDHTFNCYEDKMLLVKINKTWEEALNHCRALKAVDPSNPATDYNNNLYDLATTITPDDYTNIRGKMLDASTDEVWTGLRYLAGQWLWVGGESVQFTDIQMCPAEESCGILVKKSNTPYETRNCRLAKNFVCYRKPLITGGN